MLRRELFLRMGLLAASARAPSAHARAAAPPQRIGMLPGGGLEGSADWDAFYAVMKGLGHEEGRSVIYDRRAAQGEPERLPQLVRDLVAAEPRVIVTTGASEALAARQATRVIPAASWPEGPSTDAMSNAETIPSCAAGCGGDRTNPRFGTRSATRAIA